MAEKLCVQATFGFDEEASEIVGEVTLSGHGPFIFECLALMVNEYAKKTGVDALEIVRDLYSVVGKQAAEAGG